jgi:ribosomal protein S9
LTQQYYAGTGRRKTAVARVRLYPGTGAVVINGARGIFNRLTTRPRLSRFGSSQSDKFSAQVKVEGGGISAWAGAVRTASPALVIMDENLKPLRDNSLLTRFRVKDAEVRLAPAGPQYPALSGPSRQNVRDAMRPYWLPGVARYSFQMSRLRRTLTTAVLRPAISLQRGDLMTYSIVARDPQNGELGVAVQSHYFSVGSVVSWVEAGIGAVATQAVADVS